jgi:hypothetical protein
LHPPPTPTVYLHEKCGVATQVPSQIAHDMQLDPCYHLSTAICAQCGEVPEDECILANGVRLGDHRKQILRSKGTGYHLVRRGLWVVTALVGGTIGLSWGLSAGRVGMGFGNANSALIGMSIGAVAGLLWGHIPRLWLCKLGII